MRLTAVVKTCLACVVCCFAHQALLAQDGLDLDSFVDDEEAKAEDPSVEYGPGDDKQFTVSTEDDITALEVGDLYKNNGSLFKVTDIGSKGTDGGSFTVQRIGGDADPTPSWARTSGAGPPSIVTRESLWDLYLASGWAMHAIAGCLFATIILGINGAWIYRRGKQCPKRFVEDARVALANQDIAKFTELTRRETGLLGTISRAMVTRFDTSTLEDISERCGLEAGRYVRMLRVPLNGLNLISAIAPLLGLLGTVIGIVTCFETIAYEAASASKSQALASGIRVALFTTVGGLTVAIPAQVTLFLSSLKLNSVVSDCESLTEQFLHEIAQMKREFLAPVTRTRPKKRPQTPTPVFAQTPVVQISAPLPAEHPPAQVAVAQTQQAMVASHPTPDVQSEVSHTPPAQVPQTAADQIPIDDGYEPEEEERDWSEDEPEAAAAPPVNPPAPAAAPPPIPEQPAAIAPQPVVEAPPAPSQPKPPKPSAAITSPPTTEPKPPKPKSRKRSKPATPPPRPAQSSPPPLSPTPQASTEAAEAEAEVRRPAPLAPPKPGSKPAKPSTPPVPPKKPPKPEAGDVWFGEWDD